MTDDNPDASRLDAAETRYVRAADAHGVATESGDHRAANAAAREVASALEELILCGDEGRRRLVGLLDSADRGVRLWAASHTLRISPADAERTLMDLTRQAGSLIAFSAEATLTEWRRSRSVERIAKPTM